MQVVTLRLVKHCVLSRLQFFTGRKNPLRVELHEFSSARFDAAGRLAARNKYNTAPDISPLPLP